jgi:hypothetical protein
VPCYSEVNGVISQEIELFETTKIICRILLRNVLYFPRTVNLILRHVHFILFFPFGLLERFDVETFETVCSHFTCSIYANQPQIPQTPFSSRFLPISTDTSFQRRDDRQHIRIYDCVLADIQAGMSRSHITQKSIRSTYKGELGKKAPTE